MILNGRRFALWGLAFKPNTDDMREAPSRALMEDLLGARRDRCRPTIRWRWTRRARILWRRKRTSRLVKDANAALAGADALAIVTEWQEFRSPDFNIKAQLKSPVIFDGRNLYDPSYLARLGITYYGIGRGKRLELN